MSKIIWTLLILGCLCIFSTCGKNTGSASDFTKNSPNVSNSSSITDNTPVSTPTPEPTPTTTSPLGKFDFKNYTYPLPRGWQGSMSEITLQNGAAPLSMKEDERKIGASFVTTKYGDVTGDKEDEAFVILKIETGGSALPQIVYIFKWEAGQPNLVWYFRTGDRADGGLRDVRAENGELVIELYGQDRYIFGDVETLKITGDEEQLCCPTYFTRNRYKLTGNRFVMQGKRLTYSVAEPNAAPIENMGDKKAEEQKKEKRR